MKPSFEEVISRNLGRLRYISKKYANSVDAEDVFQEILQQLWRSYDSFGEASSVETWLYRVALNTAVSWVRKASKHKKGQKHIEVLFRDESQPSQENSEDQLLESFMNSLSDTDANILMMYLDGLSAPDMAAVVGTSANAISARIGRIRKAFEAKYIGDE